MKIEHITLGGNSVIRDSIDLLLETVNLLEDFQLYNESKILPFPRTSLQVKITATTESAMFDIMKGSDVALSNACCFHTDHRDGILDLISTLAKARQIDLIVQPKLDQFIYSMIINPLILSDQELMLAGEVELYVYYSLYLAYQRKEESGASQL